MTYDIGLLDSKLTQMVDERKTWKTDEKSEVSANVRHHVSEPKWD